MQFSFLKTHTAETIVLFYSKDYYTFLLLNAKLKIFLKIFFNNLLKDLKTLQNSSFK